MNDIFVDRMVNISVLQGVARLDFARVDQINTEDNTLKLSPSYRIAMPLDALAALAEQSSKAIAEMKEKAASSPEKKEITTGKDLSEAEPTN